LVSKKNQRDCGKIPQEGTILILEHIEVTVPDHTASDSAPSVECWRASVTNGAF